MQPIGFKRVAVQTTFSNESEQSDMTTLVLGSTGQLGRELQRLNPELTAVGRSSGFDLARPEECLKAILELRPTAVINAAAYTQVDKAESEESIATLINHLGPEACAKACAELGIPFVHVSTDYVFPGDKVGAYIESDPIGPKNAYGRTKAAGEQAVRAANPNSKIIRTAWVFSSFGNNFVKTMLRLAETRDEIGVVSDQIGCPTWAHDLAKACLVAAAEPRYGGTYHFAGNGQTSWAGFAEAIFACAQPLNLPSARVRPIRTIDYPTPAYRPPNSVLSSDSFSQTFGHKPADWQESLQKCMVEIGAAQGKA